MPIPAHPPLLIIGGGNMAQAILTGSLHAGILDPSRVIIAEPERTKHAAFESLNVQATTSISDAMQRTAPTQNATILLAVKPQMLAVVADELRPLLGNQRRIIITILAGTPSSKVRRALGEQCAIIRAMPNTPARIGQGVTALALGDGALPGDEAFAEQIFGAIGPLVVPCDESLMDAFTAVAGSGPAYLFYLAEAMIEAAIDVGFDAATADRVVRATLAGASGLLSSSNESPSALRAAVTSKGGTTAAATRVFDEGNMRECIRRAILAARDRGIELAGER